MRTMKVWFLLVLVVGVLASTVWGQNSTEKDDTGKFIIQIIDPETGAPVNEKFTIFFYNLADEDWDSEKAYFTTDNKGFISRDFYPREVGVLIAPPAENSKYCRFFHPYFITMPEEYRKIFTFVIKIEKGKITRVTKKAIIGGSVRIKLVDLAGNTVNPETSFPGLKVKIQAGVINKNLYDGTINFGILEKGETLLTGLFPDNSYEIQLQTLGLGCGVLKKSNIEVRKKEVTDVLFSIDVNDQTGVEGILTDKNGSPLKDAQVYIDSIDTSDNTTGKDIEALTNNSGYYKLTGLKEGRYEIYIIYKNGLYFGNDANSIRIEIKKNILSRKDLQLY